MLTTLAETHVLARHLYDPDWVIVDCRFTLTHPPAGRAAYVAGHIPGARYAHLEEDLSSPVTPMTGRHPLPDPRTLAAKLGAWGIDGGKQVVVYDDTFGAMASRLWWLLRWLGHEKVAVLDGGLPKWRREKLPINAESPPVKPASFPVCVNHALWLDTAAVEQGLREKSILLIDARAEERFTGEVEPLDRVAGHVPGAINVPFEDNLDFSGELLSDEALREHYGALLAGKTPKETVVMCGSGVTACHNLLALEHAGLSGARLYPGSWSEWITNPDRPVAKGE